MDGEEATEKSVRIYDDEQILDLLKRTQELEKQKGFFQGALLATIGIATSVASRGMGSSLFEKVLSILLLCAAIVCLLVGIYIIGKGLKES